MTILRAIGGFFCRIGRWIKETAWVQPLLIVGGIFLIIFSIPYITQWVQSWFNGTTAAVSFYNETKLKLENTEKGNSEADQLIEYMANYDTKDEAAKNKYGKKFFINFVKKDCAVCESNYKGFETLRDYWNQGEFAITEEGENTTLKMYSIFIDEVNSDDENLFQKYFLDRYMEYFEELNASLQTSAYFKNKGGEGSSYDTDLKTICDYDGFAAPTTFLFDPERVDEELLEGNQLCVTKAVFTVDGKNGETGGFAKARTLFDCWCTKDIFSSSYKGSN